MSVKPLLLITLISLVGGGLSACTSVGTPTIPGVSVSAHTLPEIDEAQKYLKRLPESQSFVIQQLWLVSQDHERRKDLKGAIKAMEELVKLADGSFEPHMMRLGYLHLRAGQPAKALDYYNQADSIKPSIPAKRGILEAAMKARRWDEAKQAATFLLETYPDNRVLRYKLAYIHSQLKNYASAIDKYDGVLEVMPNDESALLGKAYALIALDKREEGRDLFRNILANSPTSKAAQQGLQYARDFKWNVSQWYTHIEYNRSSPRIKGLETYINPSVTYKDKFEFSPIFSYAEIWFGRGPGSVNTLQKIGNLGFAYHISPTYTIKSRFAMIFNNDYSETSSKDGKIVYLELNRYDKVSVRLSQSYADYNADSSIGIFQTTGTLNYDFLGLGHETRGIYIAMYGPRRPNGKDHQRENLAISHAVTWRPSFIPRFSASLNAWFGKKTFPIDGDGVLIKNLSDVMLGGQGFKFSYTTLNGVSWFLIGNALQLRPACTGNNDLFPCTEDINAAGDGSKYSPRRYHQYDITGGYAASLDTLAKIPNAIFSSIGEFFNGKGQ